MRARVFLSGDEVNVYRMLLTVIRRPAFYLASSFCLCVLGVWFQGFFICHNISDILVVYLCDIFLMRPKCVRVWRAFLRMSTDVALG